MEAEQQDEYESQNQEQIQEYENWKQTQQFIYETLITQETEQTSLTIQFIPAFEDNSKQFLITGTQNTEEEQDLQDSLIISSFILPSTEQNLNFINNIKQEFRIKHDGDVNRARCNPINPNLIATKTIQGNIYLYNTQELFENLGQSQQIIENIQQKTYEDKLILDGHKGEGYGMSWHSQNQFKLLSCGYDGIVNYYDINKGTQPVLSFSETHNGPIEDICWMEDSELFTTVGDDHGLVFYDIRSNEPIQKNHHAHSEEIYSIDFNRFNKNLFLTAGAEKTVLLFDFRRPEQALHGFFSHSDTTTRVQWNPLKVSEFISSGDDKKVILWDILKVGEDVQYIEEEDGLPEVILSHCGHQSKINDINFNQGIENLICSVENDKVIHVWSPKQDLYSEIDQQMTRAFLE